MTTVTEAIKARISANNFDTAHVMTNAEITDQGEPHPYKGWF